MLRSRESKIKREAKRLSTVRLTLALAFSMPVPFCARRHPFARKETPFVFRLSPDASTWHLHTFPKSMAQHQTPDRIRIGLFDPCGPHGMGGSGLSSKESRRAEWSCAEFHVPRAGRRLRGSRHCVRAQKDLDTPHGSRTARPPAHWIAPCLAWASERWWRTPRLSHRGWIYCTKHGPPAHHLLLEAYPALARSASRAWGRHEAGTREDGAASARCAANIER